MGRVCMGDDGLAGLCMVLLHDVVLLDDCIVFNISPH